MSASRKTTVGSTVISTEEARHYLMFAQGLFNNPDRTTTPATIQKSIEQLGFLQLDSIQAVHRAHHLTMHTRFDGYQPRHLHRLLETKRSLFENWTHDASVIPSTRFPVWRARFAQHTVTAGWRKRLGPKPKQTIERVRQRIESDGPMMSADFTKENKRKGKSQWWGWSPEKTALEYLWRRGILSVTKRINFHKVYDLTEHVLPETHIDAEHFNRNQYIDWACNEALPRLGFATPKELAGYWGGMSSLNTKDWIKRSLADGLIEPVTLSPNQKHDKPKQSFAIYDWKKRLSRMRNTVKPKQVRLLCPFDPVIRDRDRCLHLFGFHYRFEAFVPQAKRQYGYYVLPILEGDQLIGRVHPKTHRDRNTLEIQGVWWEPKIRMTRARKASFDNAIERLAAFCDMTNVEYNND